MNAMGNYLSEDRVLIQSGRGNLGKGYSAKQY